MTVVLYKLLYILNLMYSYGFKCYSMEFRSWQPQWHFGVRTTAAYFGLYREGWLCVYCIKVV